MSCDGWSVGDRIVGVLKFLLCCFRLHIWVTAAAHYVR
jgi:hypothetical protein